MPSLASFLRHTESRFGLTRGDITVALFLAGTAIAGFVYTQFFESRQEITRRIELLRLAGRLDSTLAARNASVVEGFAVASDSDSVVRPWEPLDEEEVLEGASSDSRRAGKLTLQDVAPVNINTATPGVLELLPGVGEKTAQKIVEYRESRPFRKPEEIMNVKGIGPKKFAEMKPYITVGARSVDTAAEAGGPDTTQR